VALPVAILSCARIGAVHSVIFGGFSPDSIAARLDDAKIDFMITADEGLRGGRTIPLKANADAAMTRTPVVRKCIVVQHTGGKIGWQGGGDLWGHEGLGAPAIQGGRPPR